MPEGPLGGPRPATTSSLSVSIKLNKPDRELDSEEVAVDIGSSEQIFSRAKDISITEKTEMIEGEVFSIIQVDIIFRDNEYILSSINDIVNSVEDILDTSRVSATVEAV